MGEKPRVILYIAISVDGFIADASGGVEWLNTYSGGDYGYKEFIVGIDAIVMGRGTAEQAIGFGWPKMGKRTIVLASSRPVGLPAEVECEAGDPGALLGRLGAEGHTSVWLMGGAETTRRFLDAGLIDEFDIFVMPIALRAGVPLFPAGEVQPLRLIASEAFDKGVVRLRYQRA